jgi:7-keto-8-aminopelargonate synthetase-like enzyme
MDGDCGHIKEICTLAEKYRAITYIDEVHAVGLYGPTGAGKVEQLGLENKIDIVNGTLGKAYGVQGGYIACDKVVGDAKRCKAMSDALLNEHNIYVQPINYPTVDVGTERLRFAPTPFHDDGMIEDLVEALVKVFNTN